MIGATWNVRVLGVNYLINSVRVTSVNFLRVRDHPNQETLNLAEPIQLLRTLIQSYCVLLH